MNEAAEIRAFVVADPKLASILMPLFQEMGIACQGGSDPEVVAKELDRTKYEALVLDFDSNSRASAIVEHARANPANKNAVVFAIVGGMARRQEAISCGANFVFEQPLVIEDIRNVLRTARDLMVRERRRYFRCTAELPVLLIEKSSGASLQCILMNISRSGMAIVTPSPLKAGMDVELQWFLYGSQSAIKATGTVVWDDRHGKSGISFRCLNSKMQRDLDSWLDMQFVKLSMSGAHSEVTL